MFLELLFLAVVLYSMRSNKMNLLSWCGVLVAPGGKQRKKQVWMKRGFLLSKFMKRSWSTEWLKVLKKKKSILPPDFSCACSREPGFLPRENTRLTNTKCYFLTRAGAWLACVNCDFTHCSCEIRQLRRALCILTRDGLLRQRLGFPCTWRNSYRSWRVLLILDL